MSNREIKSNLKAKGQFVLHKRTMTEELSPQEVMSTIDQLEQDIKKAKDAIENNKENIKQAEEHIEKQKENLKDFKKFTEWAYDAQVSKAKALISELSDEVEERVKSNYSFDDELTPEQNERQMFAQYRQYLAVHEKTKEALSQRVIGEVFFGSKGDDKVLINFDDSPFKAYWADKN